MSDSGSPQNPVGSASAALFMVERAARPVLAELRAGYPVAADVLARVLCDGTLLAPLSAKPVGKVGAELLEALPASGGDHAD